MLVVIIITNYLVSFACRLYIRDMYFNSSIAIKHTRYICHEVARKPLLSLCTRRAIHPLFLFFFPETDKLLEVCSHTQASLLACLQIGSHWRLLAMAAVVSFTPPWWVNLLHRLPHFNFRFEQTSSDFRPEDWTYQQVQKKNKTKLHTPHVCMRGVKLGFCLQSIFVPVSVSVFTLIV